MEKIRQATNKDMTAIYMMGLDVWGEGIPTAKYISICQNSTKYKNGEWYVLENANTKSLLSSLIVYKLHLSEGLIVRGIGSIATPPNLRNKGYASLLVKEIIKFLEKDVHCDLLFLYSDIGTAIYEKLGFIDLPNEKQKYSDSVCMYYSKKNDMGSIPFDIPNYF